MGTRVAGSTSAPVNGEGVEEEAEEEREERD